MPWKKIDLEGKTFGDLTVIETVKKTRYGWLWKCKCKCGNETEALAASLRAKKKKSCGCGTRGENHYMWNGYKNLSGFYWRRVLNRAKERNLEVTLSVEDAWHIFEKQNQKCVLTGVNLSFNTTGTSCDGNASLDRIDSTKGYTHDNVQWVHKDVNIMKMDMSVNDLIYWARKITSQFKCVDVSEPTSDRLRWNNRNRFYDKTG